jgi:AhpD family alkylhydroperoxidase
MKEIEKFDEERKRLNEILMEHSNLHMKRFLNLDAHAYEDGALSRKQKELLGLATSVVLRCDDCVNYHLIQCREEDVKDEELAEVFSICFVVGGSLTIPTVRRALRAWEELKSD